jgi:hypothetical protein
MRHTHVSTTWLRARWIHCTCRSCKVVRSTVLSRLSVMHGAEGRAPFGAMRPRLEGRGYNQKLYVPQAAA